MKKIIYLLSLIYIVNSYAQELTIPTHTQYLADNPFIISPSFAGIGDYVKIRGNGLTQWVGIKDAPDMQSLAADMRIADETGIGVFFYNDRNGNTRQYGGKFSFAHHLILDKYYDQFLSFGISYNLNQFRIDIENFNVPDMAVTDDRSLTNHNFDLSVLYRFRESYLSFTAANVLNKNLDIFGINEPGRLRNYQIYAGYVIKENLNRSFEIEPSTFIQYFESDGRSSTDLNVKLRWIQNNDDYFWGGISYRFLNDQFFNPINIGPMGGIKKGSLYFAYSYQLTTNELMVYNTGTHMITIGFDILQGVSNCPCTF